MINKTPILETIKKNVGKVLVVMGGSSAEREISIRSGVAVHKSLCNYQLQSFLFDWSGKDLDFVKAMQDKYSKFIQTEGLTYESQLALALNQRLK